MRQIRRVAVLGSGVMGATIAAHLVNGGFDVLLLDIAPREASEAEKASGLSVESATVRNRIVRGGYEGLLKMKPAPFYLKEDARRIETGNFEDDMGRLRECDWVIEVIIENMAIKKQFFTEKVVPNLSAGAILSTNTSGLSVNELASVLPMEVRRNFLVTHFFNPPRYMRLLEIVGCSDTDPELLSSMSTFLGKSLGKGIVSAKDTPNFIANRIGVYAIFKSMRHMLDMGMSVEEVDAVAGTATARPKSAAFRTADLVGNDTLAHVGSNSYDVLVNDEERDVFQVPDFLRAMIDKGLLGNKTKGGFYRKEKGEGGSKVFYYDYISGEYKPSERPRFGSVDAVKQVDDPAQRLKMVVNGSDKGAEFAWKSMRDTLIYTFNRIPEIADDIVNVDNAMRWGFNWEIGPFEMFDAIGVAEFVKRAKADGVAVPAALEKIESFYRFEGATRLYYDIQSGQYREVPMDPEHIHFDILRRAGAVVEKNSNCSIVDLGDGVFAFEFHSKMNALSGDILSMTHKAIKRAESEGVGLVITNQGANFSVGANLMMLAVALAEGAYDDVAMVVKAFQQATMAVKYSRVPVVVAPFGMTLGGGCEFALHGDAINAHAETYMGLVEVGVGLLPAGGGTKEMCLRAVSLAQQFDTDVSPFIFKNFQNIGMAKVSMGAAEAFGMGYLRQGDSISMNIDRLVADAKSKVQSLARTYRPAKPLENIPAPGRSVAASIKSQLWNMAQGGFATEYEAVMGSVIADVICGGDVPAGTPISEQYLLDLEREGFLKLCGNKKTVERVQHMLKKGKPLRN
ncbi:3-hydroxyacyl-CoA dehydrogenase NAD-binding protein [Desulfurispirillum indicum S5]|uniref:3-hydroxyacyl-CoA dehydrogenase NAD-binding protein n=1 Tax=Desulfurispirillum indicum (strain ATCC BAA-1389 / DSM 22839 / S5) TaxID=653733 RepID=E6W6A8_DESIS|nr:3-hydroxyacyl-CoA dehydrogenase/enoyl-CoA hydratase family protein [Desulfurispirillum indicum]ADU66144.1 3-hydroxyacyl-CoA dehydrogenase NAD-binding protein [Desulfurispirillum indicum S5]